MRTNTVSSFPNRATSHAATDPFSGATSRSIAASTHERGMTVSSDSSGNRPWTIETNRGEDSPRSSASCSICCRETRSDSYAESRSVVHRWDRFPFTISKSGPDGLPGLDRTSHQSLESASPRSMRCASSKTPGSIALASSITTRTYGACTPSNEPSRSKARPNATQSGAMSI